MTTNIWTGDKVRLRPVSPADWKLFHENDQDSEGARLSDALYFPRSEDGTKAWAERASSAAASEGDNVFLAIETIDGALVGSIATDRCDARNGTFKYGVAIFRNHWRNGYASEAIAILLRYYFEELRYRKANAYVYAFNEASRALHERLGFVREGILREMIFTKGKPYDEYVYGLTKEEFESRNSTDLP